MEKYSILVVHFVSILFLSVIGERNLVNGDDVCGEIVNVLCVKDVLSKIAAGAANIHELANEIELRIWQQDPTKDRLANYIDQTTADLNSTYPKSEYYTQSFQMKSNINKYDFIRLLEEEYYAVGFLYNSVKTLHDTSSTLGVKIDDLLTKIQTILQTEIVCNYRNILWVYLANRLPVQHKSGIRIRKRQKRELQSEKYNAYAVIIARLSRDWVTIIRDFIGNLDSKLV